jgi:hypothetical protein
VRGLLGIVLAISAAFACVPQSPETAPNPTPLSVESTKREIATLFRQRTSALAKADLAGYQRTFELTRLALRRCLMDEFEIGSRLGASNIGFLEIGKIELYGDYLRAYVNEGFGYQRLYFRKGDGSWIQTEPKDDELGGERTKVVDGLQVAYWGIDEDVIDVLAKSAVQARTMVLENLLSAQSRQPFAIRFYPTRGAAGVVKCSLVGMALINTPGDPFIRFYLYSFDAAGTALTPETVTFLQHEGLHWAQDQYLPAISVRLPWFLAEGWPDYVGQSRSLPEIKYAVCTTPTPTFKQLSDGPPAAPQELFVQYYAFANTMVEFLFAKFGREAYPRLLTAYKDSVNAEVNFPKVLGATPAQFYDGWLTFAKTKYC